MIQENSFVSITEDAAAHARQVVADSGKAGAALRIFVKAGGCSGYQYGMAVDDRSLAGDQFTEMHGVKLVVDKNSLKLLAGSVVEWVDSLLGGGFSIKNPNAASSCGCGSSFRTKDSQGSGESESCH